MCYRKLPLKNTGDTLKGPDGTVLVTAHWVLLTVAHDILYFSYKGLLDGKLRKKSKRILILVKLILIIDFQFLNKLLQFFP